MHKLISEGDQVKLVYTTPVVPSAIDGRVSTTLHLFQSNVSKSHDVRLIATGCGHVHAVAIRTDDPAGRQDFRTAFDALTYDVISVPSDVARACRAYLEMLGLNLGVFDFAVTATEHGGSWNADPVLSGLGCRRRPGRPFPTPSPRPSWE